MIIEISENDFKAIEDHLGEIKALVVRIRMGTDDQKDDCLSNITYQANSIINLLHNGIIEDKEREVEARR